MLPIFQLDTVCAINQAIVHSSAEVNFQADLDSSIEALLIQLWRLVATDSQILQRRSIADCLHQQCE